jgi:hypothetical protein
MCQTIELMSDKINATISVILAFCLQNELLLGIKIKFRK